MAFQKILLTPPSSIYIAQMKQAEGDFDGALKAVNKEIATSVAESARSRYKSRYHSISGDGAKSIKALATQRRAQIGIGSKRAPYAQGQNFGSDRLMRFSPRREPDHFLYATLQKDREAIEEKHGQMIDDLMRKAYPLG